MMTKKDYIEFAKCFVINDFNDLTKEEVRELIMLRVASVLEKDNARFSKEHFITACQFNLPVLAEVKKFTPRKRKPIFVERTLDITDTIKIECGSLSRAGGFKHIAMLKIDGERVDETKSLYVNRTWETHQFDTVINKLIIKTKKLDAEMKTRALAIVNF